jgi:hypothetical protein
MGTSGNDTASRKLRTESPNTMLEIQSFPRWVFRQEDFLFLSNIFMYVKLAWSVEILHNSFLFSLIYPYRKKRWSICVEKGGFRKAMCLDPNRRRVKEKRDRYICESLLSAQTKFRIHAILQGSCAPTQLPLSPLEVQKHVYIESM